MLTAADPRLETIAWKDLVHLKLWEKAWELLLPVPWLVTSIAAYYHDLLIPGVLCSFFFFLTGLRLSHNAQHASLGIGRVAHHVVLLIMSMLMLASMHAVRVTHLHHHKRCLKHDDFEAAHTGKRWWRVLLEGPLFPIRLHAAAWRLGNHRARTWILAELSLITLLVSLAVLDVLPLALRWHVAAMLVGEMFTGFFAVWTVHHGCNADHQIARTERGWLKNVISYSMFFHLEHHLFPAVPTCKLDRLAARLDDVCPEARALKVF